MAVLVAGGTSQLSRSTTTLLANLVTPAQASSRQVLALDHLLLSDTYCTFVPHTNVRVEHLTNQTFAVSKIPNSSGLYDSDAYCPVALIGDFVYRIALPAFPTGDGVFGLSSDALSASDDTNMTHRVRVISSGGWYRWKSGVLQSGTPDTLDTAVWLIRVSGTIYYCTGATAGTIIDSVSDSGTYYADSSYLFDQFDYSSGGGHVVSLSTSTFIWQIAGTSPIVFAGAATPSATGTLVATAPLTLTTSGTLAGSASPSATSSIVFTPSGTGTASAFLTASAALTFTASGAETAKGTLASSPTITFTPTASASCAGRLVGASSVTFTPTGAETASGSLVSAATLAFGQSVNLTGSASITATSPLVFDLTGSLTGAGSGAMVGSASLALTTSGTPTARAALVATGLINFATTSTLSGAGALTSVIETLGFSASGNISGGVDYSNVVPLGWHEQARSGSWTSADYVRGTAWTQETRDRAPFTASDYVRGTAWTPRPKGDPTF